VILKPLPVVLAFALAGGAILDAQPQTAQTPPPQAAPSGQAPTSPGPTLDPVKVQKIKDLKLRAFHSKDPKEKQTLCQQVVDLSIELYNTADSDAVQCLRDAGDAIQAQEHQKAADAATLAKKNEEQEALASARNAFAASNITLALSELARAKNAVPDDPEVAQLESRFRQAQQVEQRVNYIRGGSALAVVGGLIGLIFVKRGKREPYLEVVDGPNLGQRYKLEREVVMIGAVEEYEGVKNDIVVPDPDRSISRFHCRILRVKKKWYLLDKDSVNYTWVDGKRVDHGVPVRLRKGSRISLAEVCDFRLRFERKS